MDSDVAGMKVPPELEGEYGCSMKGAAMFFFDVAARRFVSGTIAVVITMKIDAPMPKMGEAENDPKVPERMRTSMRSDNLIQVSLEK